MIRVLVRKEILNNLLNLRFTLAYFLCTFLLVGSAAIMVGDYVLERQTYDINSNYHNNNFSGIGHVRWYLWAPKAVPRIPIMTKVFSVGGEKDPDNLAEVAPEFSPYFHGDFKRNPLTNLFPTVDMVFIVGVIISLLIFVLTYDAISGEREEGTLKVLLSCPLPRDAVIAAKWIGGFISLAIPLITSWLIILLMLFFAKGVSIGPAEWLRMLLVFGAALLYIGVIFSLSMMLSAVARTSSTSILSLLFVWVCAIVLIPALATPLSYLIVKPEAVQKSEVTMRRLGVTEWATYGDRINAYVKKQFGKDSLSMMPQEQHQAIWRACEAEFLRGMVDSIIVVGQGQTRQELRIDNIARWILRISPYGCLQNLTTSLAGTGIQREVALRASVESFARQSLEHYFQNQDKQEFTTAGAPRFTYREPGIGDSLASGLVDISILFCMGILFFLVGYLRFIRMEVL